MRDQDRLPPPPSRPCGLGHPRQSSPRGNFTERLFDKKLALLTDREKKLSPCQGEANRLPSSLPYPLPETSW